MRRQLLAALAVCALLGAASGSVAASGNDEAGAPEACPEGRADSSVHGIGPCSIALALRVTLFQAFCVSLGGTHAGRMTMSGSQPVGPTCSWAAMGEIERDRAERLLMMMCDEDAGSMSARNTVTGSTEFGCIRA